MPATAVGETAPAAQVVEEEKLLKQNLKQTMLAKENASDREKERDRKSELAEKKSKLRAAEREHSNKYRHRELYFSDDDDEVVRSTPSF